jgi:hypothetical protein
MKNSRIGHKTQREGDIREHRKSGEGGAGVARSVLYHIPPIEKPTKQRNQKAA